MSWSLHATGTRTELKKAITDMNSENTPFTIKAHLLEAIEPFARLAGDPKISITAHGHLWDGKNYDVTSASINVHAVKEAPATNA